VEAKIHRQSKIETPRTIPFIYANVPLQLLTARSRAISKTFNGKRRRLNMIAAFDCLPVGSLSLLPMLLCLLPSLSYL
jgi:hypothetical protein